MKYCAILITDTNRALIAELNGGVIPHDDCLDGKTYFLWSEHETPQIITATDLFDGYVPLEESSLITVELPA